MTKIREVLEKLVVPQLPFPLSVPKEVAIKCANKAKKEVDQAEAQIKELIKSKLPQEIELPFGDISDRKYDGAVGWNNCLRIIKRAIEDKSKPEDMIHYPKPRK